MYLSTCFYKQLVAIVVASALTTGGIAPVRSYAGEANEYIENTHKVARERAHSLMNEVLIEAMVSAVNSQIKANPEGVKRALADVQQRLQGQLQQLEPIIAISPEEAKSMTGAELTRLSQSYRKTLTKLRASEDHIYSIAAEVFNQNAVIRKIAEDFMKNLDNYCQQGIAIDPFNQILPAIRPLMPTYSVHFTYSSGQNDGQADGNRSVSLGNGEEAAAIWTTVYAINTSVALVLITGKGLAAAMTGATAAQMGAAALAGFGVTLVIAVIVLAVMSEMARKESEKMVKDQRRMFIERAGIEDGRNYFKEQCRATRTLFGDMSAEMNKIAAGDAAALQSLKDSEPEVKKAMKSYTDILKAYHAKRTEIQKELKENATEEQKRAAAKQLEETEEGKRFKKMGEDLKPETLVPIIRHSLLANFSNAAQNSAAVDFGKGLDWEGLEARNKALMDLAISKNVAETELTSIPNWQAELKQNIEIRSLYARLDRLIIRKAEWIFSVTRDLNKAEFEKIKREMGEWYNSLRATSAIYPSSALLKQLEKDFRRFETIGVML